ncbi:uncharacterized protein HMPREF1541_00688 [Cyphellophora europaea CBS 101466]|uniref:Uncharacterized protein n=1 Tax=Cyphellophora europaea (strain CBS 101466) TaxID=1220924 RepID=W2SEQ0_CYPE1|nr:uncharacterized protein HMPREF1541_00688 [Cyphellophora europaea CBS 101466]ETN46503.1 hypothetical protein HMPREF1541_00688 [Cyphellophora europaea CBS 101466]
MAIQPPLANDKKRVKVYELRDNDWFDRGTGFCTGQVINDEPRVFVESEDQPERMLLETKIRKDDGYQKQQDTLIVWTESNGTDMALSFQEAEGCAVIWDFVHNVQQQLKQLPDDGLSDDALDGITTSFALSAPALNNLDEIEQTIRAASISQGGREALAKFVLREEYLSKLIPLLSDAEDLESLSDLHRLCNIMKAFILMNDSSVIEHMVDDDIILGVVGALEYDPDFPTHKANHRQYLGDQTRYKEVVEIKDQQIKKKIRQTWRLQYLKDVVLARILDDPTFGVLNSLIYFNQVEIVQHLQQNTAFLKELFAIFNIEVDGTKQKEEAVQFLQQCAAITKTLQLQSRENLLNNFIQHGLFAVITFAIRHAQPSMRTTGIDILVALLDHNPNMMRNYMLKAVSEKKTPLTDILIDLLHAETDLGVKNQLSDAIKILLDPQPPTNEPMNNRNSSEFVTKLSRPPQLTPTQAANEQFAQDNFDRSCRKLFKPLKDLEQRVTLNCGFQEVSLYSYLVEILTFFLRQHSMRSRHFVSSENLTSRVAQLLQVRQKPLKLTALKFFRTAIALQDQFYSQQILKTSSFEPIINIVIETMPRDNLLNSACLEMFDFIRKETIKPIIIHLGEHYRPKLQSIIYVDTFEDLLMRYDQLTADKPEMEHTLFSQDEDSPSMSRQNLSGRWQGIPDMDASEEDYFNTSDDDEDAPVEEDDRLQWNKSKDVVNGTTSPVNKPLVDYPDDDDDVDDLLMDPKPVVTPQTPLTPESESGDSPDAKGLTPDKQRQLQPSPDIRSSTDPASELQHPPERIAEKRRRQEDEEEDELGKLSTGVKRRNSSSASSASSLLSQGTGMKRKKSFLRSKQATLNTGEPNQVPTKGTAGENQDEPDASLKRSPRIKVSLSNQSTKANESAEAEKEKPAPEETAK